MALKHGVVAMFDVQQPLGLDEYDRLCSGSSGWAETLRDEPFHERFYYI